MKQFIKWALLVSVAVGLAGCCACRAFQTKTRRPLVGTEWQLIQLGGRNIRVETEKFVVRFAADGTVSGRGECNTLSGRYETGKDNGLKIGPLASTLRACPDGMETEAAFAGALEAVDRYDMDGPMLLLLSDGELQAVFQAQE